MRTLVLSFFTVMRKDQRAHLPHGQKRKSILFLNQYFYLFIYL